MLVNSMHKGRRNKVTRTYVFSKIFAKRAWSLGKYAKAAKYASLMWIMLILLKML